MTTGLKACTTKDSRLNGTGVRYPRHLRPSRPRLLRFAAERAVNHHRAHLLDAHLEVERRDAIALEVGCRVEEIDRVRHAVFHRELDGVHLVAERVVEGAGVLDDTRAKFRREVAVIDEVAA